MKIIFFLIATIILSGAAFADVDLNANCGGGTYTPNSNEKVFLSGNLACNLDSTAGASALENFTLDLSGYTLTGYFSFYGAGEPATRVDIGNGIMTGFILIDGSNTNQINIHDIVLGECVGIVATDGGFVQDVLIENSEINHSTSCLGSDAPLDVEGMNIIVKNTTLLCSGGVANDAAIGVSGNPIGTHTYEQVTLESCDTPSYTSLSSVTSTIVLKNTSLLVDVVSGMTVIDMQPFRATLKDQNNQNIDGMAKVLKTAGGRFGRYDYNPSSDFSFAIDNGTGTAYMAKNITINSPVNGLVESSYPTYDVTVKSRKQSQTKQVTFNSPANETFTLDFTSEDNVVTTTNVDNRTSTEKLINSVTGTVLPILTAIAPIVLLALSFI